MTTILDTIAAATRQRVRAQQERCPLDAMKALASELGSGQGTAFEAALARDGLSFICEVKKASPSKGVIDPDFRYLDIARSYEDAGADCVSCLTEPQWFLGSDQIFEEIRAQIATPMIRKDFTVDAYQIYQARVMGANAVLLICAILSSEDLARHLALCEQLGLAALVEAHDADEIKRAVNAGARIIGVNNRNLKDFSVDFDNARRLRELVPARCVYVAESGVRTARDVAAMAAMGADAALIGEAFMRSPDKAATLAKFRAAAAQARHAKSPQPPQQERLPRNQREAQ